MGASAMDVETMVSRRNAEAVARSLASRIDTNIVSHYYHVMKNVTVTLEEETARWARVAAAKRDTSVSRMLGEMLQERMIREQGYASAARDFFSVAPRQLRTAGQPLPDREDLHDRAGFR